MSVGLVFHLAAVAAMQLVPAPSSLVERRFADLFGPYYELFDLGHAFRYYAPEPGPTPVVTARLTLADGTEEVVRLPDRGLRPRLRYQRHLNLANHLFDDFQRSREAGMSSRWASSYARHLGKAYPGCAKVALYGSRHLLPNLEQVRVEGVPDVDDERFFEVPTLIGEYACDGSLAP